MKAYLLSCLFLQTLIFSNNSFSEQNQDLVSEITVKQACSDSVINALGKYLGLESFRPPIEGSSFIVSSACKQNPANKNQIFSAVAYNSEKSAEIKKIIIAVVDANTNQVISDFQSEVEEDAGVIFDSYSFKIDTAPYKVAHNIRAFGVDFTSGYNFNCGDGGSGSERTLYIQDGHHLRQIMTLTMSYWSYIQEGQSRCNSIADDSEITIIENANLSISISSSSTKGFKDLLVSAINSRDDGKPSKRKPFHYKLRFDGNQYPTQELHNAFEKWWQ